MKKPKEYLEDLRLFFKEKNLNPPFIPQDLHHSLTFDQNFHLFSTRQLIEDPYNLNTYIAEIFSEKINDYFITGISGHGITSNNFHYYLKYKSLILFIQFQWNPSLENFSYQKSKINHYLAIIPILVTNIENARTLGLIKLSRQLLIVKSDKQESGWTWIRKGQEKIDKLNWNRKAPVFLNALYSIPSES